MQFVPLIPLSLDHLGEMILGSGLGLEMTLRVLKVGMVCLA